MVAIGKKRELVNPTSRLHASELITTSSNSASKVLNRKEALVYSFGSIYDILDGSDRKTKALNMDKEASDVSIQVFTFCSKSWSVIYFTNLGLKPNLVALILDLLALSL